MPEYKYFSPETDPNLFTCQETGEQGIDPDFVAAIDKLRGICGFPFAINYGYRSSKHSREALKDKPGMHSMGKAVDIKITGSHQRFVLVEKAIERAMTLRSKITDHPLLHNYFEVVTIEEFIPLEYRKSGLKMYYNGDTGWNNMESAWEKDEFVLDPTKINLFIGRTGVDGDTFKRDFLMDQFGIQINKTTRNTVLFMTNIGTTRSSVVHLVGVLIKISQQIEARSEAETSCVLF